MFSNKNVDVDKEGNKLWFFILLLRYNSEAEINDFVFYWTFRLCVCVINQYFSWLYMLCVCVFFYVFSTKLLFFVVA